MENPVRNKCLKHFKSIFKVSYRGLYFCLEKLACLSKDIVF
uniref:Uncharacterized protein n=1 Tax=Arundo donax TaxID=35708 RepID=A0A0A9AAC0_ARUDO